MVKNHLQCRRPGFDPWVEKIAWRRERLPTPVFWPEELQGPYRPWSHRVGPDRATFTFTSYKNTTVVLILSPAPPTIQIPHPYWHFLYIYISNILDINILILGRLIFLKLKYQSFLLTAPLLISLSLQYIIKIFQLSYNHSYSLCSPPWPGFSLLEWWIQDNVVCLFWEY